LAKAFSTAEAEYAYRVYSSGSLLLNWVAFYSAFPIIAIDEENLTEKGNFDNYDAHFVPVFSHLHPNTTNYHACEFGEEHQYTEMVVFESSQMLPHYIVELQPSLPRNPPAMLPPTLTSQDSVAATITSTPTPTTTSSDNQKAKPVNEWRVDEVCDWVSTLSFLSKPYKEELTTNNITGKVLKSMSKQDWKEVGVKKFSDIRTLILDVAKLM